MTKYLLICFLGLVLFACNSPKEASGSAAKAPKLIHDSTEYEVVIIDPGFESWYTIHYSPVLDRTNEAYSSMNRFALMNWNRYFTDGKFRKVIDSFIAYPPATDFGIEANRKLYWYFKYVEETCKVPLF